MGMKQGSSLPREGMPHIIHLASCLSRSILTDSADERFFFVVLPPPISVVFLLIP